MPNKHAKLYFVKYSENSQIIKLLACYIAIPRYLYIAMYITVVYIVYYSLRGPVLIQFRCNTI